MKHYIYGLSLIAVTILFFMPEAQAKEVYAGMDQQERLIFDVRMKARLDIGTYKNSKRISPLTKSDQAIVEIRHNIPNEIKR